MFPVQDGVAMGVVHEMDTRRGFGDCSKLGGGVCVWRKRG
jgi:hypothetical protein